MQNKNIEKELNNIGFKFSNPLDYYDIFYNDRVERLDVVYDCSEFTYMIFKSRKFKTFKDFEVYLREEKFKELF